MATIIRGRELATDSWLLLEQDATGVPDGSASDIDLIVPLPLWQARRDELLARNGRLGLRVTGDEEPESFAADLDHFAVVAIDFPKFTDGRGYSLAHLLRTRHGYSGELRAVGDIYRDHLHFLESCGFDSCVLREGEDAAAALASFGPFGESYQGSCARPVPLFRRRLRGVSDGAGRT